MNTAAQSCVAGIFVAPRPEAALEARSEVQALAGQGIDGDRYFVKDGTFSGKDGPDREVTLIEEEALAALKREYDVEMTPAESRRNILTRGVALNHLVDREFRVGGAVLRGMRLCEPCGHLEKLTRPGVKKGLIHRGGLRARVVASGPIRVGDIVEVRGE